MYAEVRPRPRRGLRPATCDLRDAPGLIVQAACEVNDLLVAVIKLARVGRGPEGRRGTTADAARAVEEPDVFDVVLLDPPRRGAGSPMVDLACRRPKRSVCVACGPATLFRNSRILVAGGWPVRGLTFLDVFRQTSQWACPAFCQRDQVPT